MNGYVEGTYRIRSYSYGWAVCKKVWDGIGEYHWRKISDTYLYYGWALHYARTHCIKLS